MTTIEEVYLRKILESQIFMMYGFASVIESRGLSDEYRKKGEELKEFLLATQRHE